MLFAFCFVLWLFLRSGPLAAGTVPPLSSPALGWRSALPVSLGGEGSPVRPGVPTGCGRSLQIAGSSPSWLGTGRLFCSPPGNAIGMTSTAASCPAAAAFLPLGHGGFGRRTPSQSPASRPVCFASPSAGPGLVFPPATPGGARQGLLTLLGSAIRAAGRQRRAPGLAVTPSAAAQRGGGVSSPSQGRLWELGLVKHSETL